VATHTGAETDGAERAGRLVAVEWLAKDRSTDDGVPRLDGFLPGRRPKRSIDTEGADD
jgi:hypothetical protein